MGILKLKKKKPTCHKAFVVWFSTFIFPNSHIWIVVHILEKAVTMSGTLTTRRWNYRKFRLLNWVIIHCRSGMGMPIYGHGWDIHDARRPASQRLLSLSSSGPPTAGAPEMKMTIMATSANKYMYTNTNKCKWSMYFFKLSNVFFQMVKCICPNWQRHLSKL